MRHRRSLHPKNGRVGNFKQPGDAALFREGRAWAYGLFTVPELYRYFRFALSLFMWRRRARLRCESPRLVT